MDGSVDGIVLGLENLVLSSVDSRLLPPPRLLPPCLLPPCLLPPRLLSCLLILIALLFLHFPMETHSILFSSCSTHRIDEGQMLEVHKLRH